MRSKLMLSTIGLLLCSGINLSAATIFASDGSTVESDANICANDSYYYQTDNKNMYEADVISANSKVLLSTVNASNGEIEMSFPTNVENLSVYVFEYTDTGKELSDQFDFSISDCGYESIVEDYKTTAPKVGIEKRDSGLGLTAPDLENYKLYINQVEANDDGNSKQVKFKDGKADLTLESDIIQITEEYTNDEGKDKELFFELDLSNDIIIRRLSNLDLSVIAPMDYIDKKILIRIIGGLIALVILYLINIMFVKKYRAKKEYKRKYKELKAKHREQVKQKKLAEDNAKKEKYKQLKQKKLDKEHRANLEIRK